MKSPTRLPSLNALRAFEAVARRLSYARAADELFVTKAAVAQQVRQLEVEIGATLVERAGRGLKLTEAGQAGMRDPGVDALIRWGAGDYPGFATTLLFEENVFPVCSPRLVEGSNPLLTPHDLKAHTLLHLDWNPSFSTWPTWADWLKAAGAAEVDATRGVWFNHMSMALLAAAQGQGVTLTTLAIAADELAAGRVVAPFEIEVHTSFGYYFLCRPEQANSPRISALRDFLKAEAEKSAG